MRTPRSTSWAASPTGLPTSRTTSPVTSSAAAASAAAAAVRASARCAAGVATQPPHAARPASTARWTPARSASGTVATTSEGRCGDLLTMELPVLATISLLSLQPCPDVEFGYPEPGGPTPPDAPRRHDRHKMWFVRHDPEA